MAVCGIGDLIGDDGEEIFALHGAAEAGFGAAVAVVDDAGVDEGAEEGEAVGFTGQRISHDDDDWTDIDGFAV